MGLDIVEGNQLSQTEYQAAHNRRHTPTTDSLKCNHCSRLCCSHWTCSASMCLQHLTVSQSTSPAMDCWWWLRWTIVNWLLMRRGIKKYRKALWRDQVTQPKSSIPSFALNPNPSPHNKWWPAPEEKVLKGYLRNWKHGRANFHHFWVTNSKISGLCCSSDL